jgi:hypothetical protein
VEQIDAGTRAKDSKGTTVADARAAVEKARDAVAEPGETYTPPRVSLKGQESPAETEEARFAPYPHTTTGRRTALAEWITDRRNPLTARVAVNHIWMRFFGEPLVPAVFDFGRRSPAPPQQALLDWLAVELMEHGWSMRHIERLIVTGSVPHEFVLRRSVAKSDDRSDNKYLWHERGEDGIASCGTVRWRWRYSTYAVDRHDAAQSDTSMRAVFILRARPMTT